MMSMWAGRLTGAAHLQEKQNCPKGSCFVWPVPTDLWCLCCPNEDSTGASKLCFWPHSLTSRELGFPIQDSHCNRPHLFNQKARKCINTVVLLTKETCVVSKVRCFAIEADGAPRPVPIVKINSNREFDLTWRALNSIQIKFSATCNNI